MGSFSQFIADEFTDVGLRTAKMSIIRNQYPILEYDTASEEILKPNLNMEKIQLPEKCVYAFLGGTVDAYAKAHEAICVSILHTITKDYPVYVVDYNGSRTVLCQAPLGAPAAAQSMDSLIACGVRKIVSAGSCGALQDLPENAFLVPVKALRDEGTSYHYLQPSRFVEPDAGAIQAITEVLERKKVPWSECITWTTDGFFRETEDMASYRKEEGCSVVEMECAALAACAIKRGAQFGQLLFTADTLADPQAYDARDWGAASSGTVLPLLFEIADRL